MPMGDIFVLLRLKMKGYDALDKIAKDDLHLGVLWELLGFQVQGIDEVDEDNLGLLLALPEY